MSQINNISGGQPPQVNQPNADPAFTRKLEKIVGDASSRVNSGRAGGSLPRELQNARQSTSVLAKLGFVASYVLRCISDAAISIGRNIAEATCWGLREFLNRCHPSPQPPEPRLQEAEIDPKFNFDLKDYLLQRQLEWLPAEYLEAGNAACAEMTGKFPGINMRSMEQLYAGNVQSKVLRYALNDALEARGDRKITPEQFAADIKSVLFSHAKKLMLAEKVRESFPDKAEGPDRDSMYIASRILLRLKNEGSPLMAEFENARTAEEMNAFLAKTDKLAEEVISLLDKLPGAVSAAKRDATERLAKLLGVPADQVGGMSKNLGALYRTLDLFSGNILNGSAHVRPDMIEDELGKKVDKFIGGIAGMMEEIDSIGVSEKLKEKWKKNIYNDGHAFPKEMRVAAKFSDAGAKADVSALVSAVNGGAKPEEIFEIAKDIGCKVLEQVFKENPQFRENWASKKWGGDDQQQILRYVWDTVLEANPALREAFAKRPELGEQLEDRSVFLQRAESETRNLDVNIVMSLAALLQNPAGQ